MHRKRQFDKWHPSRMYKGVRGGGRRVKRARFGKLAFLLQNGAFFGPKIGHFWPFRTTFSARNRQMPILIARKCGKFRPFRTTFEAIWQIGVFIAERSLFLAENWSFSAISHYLLSEKP